MGPGAPAGIHPLVVDLASGDIRQLPEERDGQFGLFDSALTPTRDGKYALTFTHHGSMYRMAKVPLDGHGPSQTLLTLTHAAFSLDIGPDGGIYLDQNDRPVELVRFPAEGGRVERIVAGEVSWA